MRLFVDSRVFWRVHLGNANAVLEVRMKPPRFGDDFVWAAISADMAREFAHRQQQPVERREKKPKARKAWRCWSPQDIDRCRALYPDHGPSRTAEILGRTYSSVRNLAGKIGLSSRKFWSPAEVDRLRSLYPETSNKEIGSLLGRSRPAIDAAGRVFGLEKSAAYLKAHARLQKGQVIGREYQFPKGHAPANKGLRRPGYAPGRMAETQFKKGDRPHDWKPVGTITTDGDGYQHIKVREPRPNERNAGGCGRGYSWEFLHQHTWEKNHGPIPPAYAVAFKDGDRTNCTIENLECIPQAELARRNSMWDRYPRELVLAIVANGALKRKLRRTNG